MRTLALEEHYATQALLDASTGEPQIDLQAFPALLMMQAQLRDLDAGRIAAM